jgi:hypothetical protein
MQWGVHTFPKNMDKLLWNETVDAKKAMEEAQAEYKVAKEAFTQWKQANGILPESPVYQELKQDVERNFVAVERKEEIYKKLVETYDNLVKKMPFIEPYNTENRKRIRMDSSIKSDCTNGSGMSQPAFRTRIVERDQKCAISGMDANYCEACHIVPKRIFQKNGIPEKKLWDKQFPNGCVQPDYRVMDVRNGILLSVPIHHAFDSFDLTIVKTKSLKFKVLTNPFADLSAEISNYDGIEIQFNPDKPNEWPGDLFLRFHNECYEAKKENLRAAAEPSDNSFQTLAELNCSVSKVESWFEAGIKQT